MSAKRRREVTPPASPAPTPYEDNRSEEYEASFFISPTITPDVLRLRFRRNAALFAMCRNPCPRCYRSFYQITLVNDPDEILSGVCNKARRLFYRFESTPLTHFNIPKLSPKPESKKKRNQKRKKNRQNAKLRKNSA
jgi:hypothetical protein